MFTDHPALSSSQPKFKHAIHIILFLSYQVQLHYCIYLLKKLPLFISKLSSSSTTVYTVSILKKLSLFLSKLSSSSTTIYIYWRSYPYLFLSYLYIFTEEATLIYNLSLSYQVAPLLYIFTEEATLVYF
jgi:hypothetical protein